MGRLILAIGRAEQALAKFDAVLSIDKPTEIERDASIQRFEFTFEAVWKMARHYLYEVEGVDVGSPKGVIRGCRESSILSIEEASQALSMADDRNLTSHTYDRALAQEIYGRLHGHAALMHKWIHVMKQHVE